MNAVVGKKADAAKVLNTMGGKPTPCSEATCQPCHRVDLQLLPVTPSVVPKMHFQALANAKYTWHPVFDPEFTSVKRNVTVPVARLARPGYIYIYYEERKCWDVWQVMNSSLTRQIVYQADSSTCSKRLESFIGTADQKSCSQGAKNLSGHTICIEGAQAIEKVWLAYSPELWPLRVLERYEENPQIDVINGDGKKIKKPLRQVRGRELPLKDMVAGKAAPGCMRLANGVLNQFVADFVDRADKNYLKAFSQVVQPIDIERIGKATSLVNRIREIEKSSGAPNDPGRYVEKSVIVGLADDIGVAEDHNQLRLLAKEAANEWVRGGPNLDGDNDDPLRPWKLRSSLHEQMIEDWVHGHNAEKWRNIAKLGGDVDKVQRTITRNEYETIRRYAAETGKQHDAPGTKYVPVEGSDNWVRVIPPNDVLESHIQENAKNDSKKMIERYREKVRYEDLTTFRRSYQREIEKWEGQMAALDEDFVQWLLQPRLSVVMKYDHDEKVSLINPDESKGTPRQHVEAWIARVRSVGKVWGGGAVTDVSARELIKAYGKDPDAPAKWIDEALLEPFNVYENIYGEAGKRKDFVEKLNGLTRELPEKIKEAIHAYHEIKEAHLHALQQASHQAAQKYSTMVAADQAKNMNHAVIAEKEAEKILKLQIRTAAVVDLMTNPSAERFVTIKVNVPPGESLDRLAKAFEDGKLEIDLETKGETPRSRQTRKSLSKKLRGLAGRVGLDKPEYQGVMLTQKSLAELERIAISRGEEMVDVVADDALGANLPAKFKLPKSTALKLIGEQARNAIFVRKAILTTGSCVAFALACFQWNALWTSLKKLKELEGVAYTDTLMTVFSSAAGLVEGAMAVTSGYFEIKAAGTRLALESTAEWTAKWASGIRLAGGIAGAAGSAFDTFASYAKYCSAQSRGSKDAMKAYGYSVASFGISSFALGGGAGFSFAANTASRIALSKAVTEKVGQIAGRAVVRAAAVEAAELVGTAIVATEMLAATLTGVGIVLAIGGFCWAIYAESLEDDLNEIFLKRSYWGNEKAPMAPFGSLARPSCAVGRGGSNVDATPTVKFDATAFRVWALSGLEQEAEGFGAISVGCKCVVEWDKKEFLKATLEVQGGTSLRASYALATFDSNKEQLLVAKASEEKFESKEDGKVFAIEVKLPTEVFWMRTAWASFAYYVFENDGHEILAHETIRLKRPE